MEESLTVQNSSKTILLVDDDRLVIATLSKGLRDSGYTVVTANSAEEALQIGEQMSVDLAIFDIRMPGISGIDAARQLYATSSIPFMMLTAYGDGNLVQEASDIGALGYLIKPVELPQILPAVETALKRAEEINKLKQKEVQLETALNSGRETSMAIGVIMERYRLSHKQAFETLRNQARSQRRKITDVAKDIISGIETINMQIDFSNSDTQ